MDSRNRETIQSYGMPVGLRAESTFAASKPQARRFRQERLIAPARCFFFGERAVRKLLILSGAQMFYPPAVPRGSGDVPGLSIPSQRKTPPAIRRSRMVDAGASSGG